MALKPMVAADLIAQAYKGSVKGSVDTFDDKGVQAFALKDRTLVIPGTNELSDWTRYNLPAITWKTLGSNGQYKFHAGFLKHAQMLLEFARDNRIKRITGHSLGAASSQLLAATSDVEALNFAAPKVVFGKWKVVHSKPIVNLNRKDDRVGKIPRWFYKHIGQTYWLNTKVINDGGDHKIKHYVSAMQMAHVQAATPVRFA